MTSRRPFNLNNVDLTLTTPWEGPISAQNCELRIPRVTGEAHFVNVKFHGKLEGGLKGTNVTVTGRVQGRNSCDRLVVKDPQSGKVVYTNIPENPHYDEDLPFDFLDSSSSPEKEPAPESAPSSINKRNKSDDLSSTPITPQSGLENAFDGIIPETPPKRMHKRKPHGEQDYEDELDDPRKKKKKASNRRVTKESPPKRKVALRDSPASSPPPVSPLLVNDPPFVDEKEAREIAAAIKAVEDFEEGETLCVVCFERKGCDIYHPETNTFHRNFLCRECEKPLKNFPCPMCRERGWVLLVDVDEERVV